MPGDANTGFPFASFMIGAEPKAVCCCQVCGQAADIAIFDVEVPGGVAFRESATVAPGAEVVVAATPLAWLGLTICYDLRFGELYRALKGGADPGKIVFSGVGKRQDEIEYAQRLCNCRHRRQIVCGNTGKYRPDVGGAMQKQGRDPDDVVVLDIGDARAFRCVSLFAT